jgi:mycothiol synthase
MFELPTVDYPADPTPPGPDGLVLRPYAGEADVPLIVDIINRELEADGVPNREGVEDVAARYRHSSEMFDPGRDVTVAEVDGVPVGYGERSWVDTSDGEYREYRCDGAVLPEWRRRGIGTALLTENMRRSAELAATHETDRPRVFGSWASDRQAGAIALLRKSGFEPVRWFFEMTRDLRDPIPDVPLPERLEVRPVAADQIRQIWHADVEAFQDHWGGFDSSDEALQRWLDRPSFDPTLWAVAWDGDEVAGGSINAIEKDENEALGIKRGWLHSVFTRRPWRRRGLASALVARSLVMLRERGMDTGILGVDADNPTGALGLYERIGFGVAERSTAWRKPFEVTASE